MIHGFQEMDHSKISKYLEEHGWEWTSWKRNPPFASNIGRVWEQKICSAKAVLSSLLKSHVESLADKSLQILLIEVEAVFNFSFLITETINNITSLIPLSLITIAENIAEKYNVRHCNEF